MKLTNVVDDVVGMAFGFAIVGVVVTVFGTVIVLSYLADTRLFKDRSATLS